VSPEDEPEALTARKKESMPQEGIEGLKGP